MVTWLVWAGTELLWVTAVKQRPAALVLPSAVFRALATALARLVASARSFAVVILGA